MNLVDTGAGPDRYGENPVVWLAEALEQVGVRHLRHAGVHRYLFPLGTPTGRRRLRPGLASTRLYPKRIDLAA